MKMNLQELEAAKILVDMAIREDVGPGDITTENLIPSGIRKKAEMTAKDDGVIAGLEVARLVFLHFGHDLLWVPLVTDGDQVRKGDVIVKIETDYKTLLTGERTALNFLQRMSGIATISSFYRKILENTNTRLLDTRCSEPQGISLRSSNEKKSVSFSSPFPNAPQLFAQEY